jgi:hypothetical protein
MELLELAAYPIVLKATGCRPFGRGAVQLHLRRWLGRSFDRISAQPANAVLFRERVYFFGSRCIAKSTIFAFALSVST